MVEIIQKNSTITPILGVSFSNEKAENCKIMTAKAVLQCRPNSHPFPERTILLDQPVKVGRSVAKSKPAGNNAIFDCKVLSRYHASLWYEDGKFYLKDTKSSNGTFVNNQRLTRGSEREVCSSDIVQFGVDVVENFKKVSHGCVIATLKLYLPDGQEAKASSITAESGSVCELTVQELYVLQSCLAEASQREQQINDKLVTLLSAVNSAHEVAFHGWTTMVDEDILLQRLELLQGQLATFSKTYPEGDAKADVRQLQAEKGQIEINAKQSVAKILKEKLDIEIQCADLERKATSMNIELESLKNLLVAYKTEIDELLVRQDVQTFELQELADNLKNTKVELGDMKELSNEEKEKNEGINSELVSTIEKLKAENDFIKEQCNAIKSKYENLKNDNRLSEIEIEGPVSDANRIYETLRHTLRNLRDKFRDAQDSTPDVQADFSQLTRDLEQTAIKDAKFKSEKSFLEEDLVHLKGKLIADGSIAEHFQSVEAASINKLSDFMNDVLSEKIISKAEICKDMENNQTLECTLLKTMDEKDSESQDKNKTYIQICIYVVSILKEEIRKAAEASRQSKNNRKNTEEKLDQTQKKYMELSESLATTDKMTSSLRQRLATQEGFMLNKKIYLNDVLDHMNQLESAADHIHAQFYSLANNLAKEREQSEKLRNEVNSVRSKLEAAEKLSQTVAEETKELQREDGNNLNQTTTKIDPIEENILGDPTIREPLNDLPNVSSTNEYISSNEHCNDSVLLDQQIIVTDALSENFVSQDSTRLDQSLKTIKKPTGNLQDQLTALKQENNRLRSQLNIQNEEFSDLAMRNQIVIPTWYMTILIGFLYYSWSLIATYFYGN